MVLCEGTRKEVCLQTSHLEQFTWRSSDQPKFSKLNYMAIVLIEKKHFTCSNIESSFEERNFGQFINIFYVGIC